MLVGMKASSLDLRQKILRAYDQRLGSQRALAALFGVSQSFVEKLVRRRRTTGEIAPRPHAGGRRALCDATALAQVRPLVHEQPAATLAECCARRLAQRGLRVSVPTMGRLVIALKLPRETSRSTPANRTPSVSSRHGRPSKRRPPRSPPGASRASMNQASTSP
jgi:transposase